MPIVAGADLDSFISDFTQTRQGIKYIFCLHGICAVPDFHIVLFIEVVQTFPLAPQIRGQVKHDINKFEKNYWH